MRFKMIGLAAVALMAAFGAAQAQESKTIAVSIPAADHGWTGGVVYHAQEQAKALEARYPGLKVIVKTSPDGASSCKTNCVPKNSRRSVRTWIASDMTAPSRPPGSSEVTTTPTRSPPYPRTTRSEPWSSTTTRSPWNEGKNRAGGSGRFLALPSRGACSVTLRRSRS